MRYPYQYQDGYIWHSSYPYFAYNGYIHRYSNRDICNFELVDSQSRQTVESYQGQICNIGYDTCAQQRDLMNSQENSAGVWSQFNNVWRNGILNDLE